MHLQHTDPGELSRSRVDLCSNLALINGFHYDLVDGAVKIAQNLNIRKTFAAHWGTWIMSDEPCKYLRASSCVCHSPANDSPRPPDNRPPEDLVKARNKLGMSADAFEVTPAGKTMIIA